MKKVGFDHTNSARRSRLEGSWEPGKAQMARSPDFRWVGSGIWARGKGLRTSPEGKSRREVLQMEDE